jgi:hypothetical protein
VSETGLIKDEHAGSLLASGLIAEPEITIVGEGTLTPSGRAKKKIIDERQ